MLRPPRALPAEAVSGPPMLESRFGPVIRTEPILVLPESRLLGGVELGGEAVSRECAGGRPDDSADHRADRAAHRGACHGPRGAGS